MANKGSGYYTRDGYKGRVGNSYMLFATEQEYRDYFDFNKEQQYYVDTQGMFGKCGEVINDEDMINYWNSHYASDPVLSGYKTFEEWWGQTKQFLKEM